MKDLNPTDGFILQGWMVTDLGLGGLELMTFALVHQFSQSKAGCYKGGVPYLASWLNCQPNTARKWLQSLTQKGLIQATRGTIDGVPYCYYESSVCYTPQKLKDSLQNLRNTPAKFEGGTLQNLRVENNIDNIEDINNNISQRKEIYREKKFIPPTNQQVADYARQRGFVDPIGFAYYFTSYYAAGNHPWHLSNDKPMKDWKRAVITWESFNKNKRFNVPSTVVASQMSNDAFLQSLQ